VSLCVFRAPFNESENSGASIVLRNRIAKSLFDESQTYQEEKNAMGIL
jgi:hypothetical protein